MRNIQCINIAVDYLEQHLTENIGLRDISNVVNFSEYHFHRMFRGITGYTLKDYILRRRLYLSAIDIVNEVDSIANISQKYQFSTQSSFTVAFKQMHGLTPGELRREQLDYKVFGRLILNDIVLDKPLGLQKEPGLVILQSFTVIGLQCETKYSQLEKEDNPINRIWMSSLETLSSLKDKVDNTFLYSVYQYDPEKINHEDISFIYTLGYKCDDIDLISDKIVKKVLPMGRYVVFQVDLNKGNLFNVYDYIDEQWFPQSEYILSSNPDFEVHHPNNIVDIYISIEG